MYFICLNGWWYFYVLLCDPRRWQFMTEKHDIGFSITYQSTDRPSDSFFSSPSHSGPSPSCQTTSDPSPSCPTPAGPSPVVVVYPMTRHECHLMPEDGSFICTRPGTCTHHLLTLIIHCVLPCENRLVKGLPLASRLIWQPMVNSPALEFFQK